MQVVAIMGRNTAIMKNGIVMQNTMVCRITWYGIIKAAQMFQTHC
jgi:hypothetical protein